MSQYPIEVQSLVNSGTFDGYVIVDWDSVFTTTDCPNKAVALCIERARLGGEQLQRYVKAYRIGTAGKYHANPGERLVYEFDWQDGARQLFA